jgi:hypothetical protein
MAVWWTSIVGIVIICWTLREIFRDLFQPSETGTLSSFVSRQMFRISKCAPSTMRMVGPLSIVVVIFCWTFAIAAGFALIYWGRFPQAFRAPSHESHEAVGRFWTVLYFSLASLTTLGSGEVAPQGAWIRIVAASESLIGMLLITASISWIVLIYPALGRMRTLSRRASTLVWAQERTGVDLLAGSAEGLLSDLAASVFRVRVDFIHFPVIYYFHADTEGASLPRSLIQLSELAERACDRQQPDQIRLGAAMLSRSISDTAAILAAKFVGEQGKGNTKGVFEAMRRDHLEHTRDTE